MLNPMRIRQNWRELLLGHVEGKEWAPISRRAKLNSTYLRDVLERNQTPQVGSAEKLSDALGVKITDWFLEAEAGAESTASQPVEMTSLNLRSLPMDVPVRGSAACGKDGLFEMQGQTLEYVRRLPRIMGVKDAYALYALGDSMSPWREHGELVYVHPHAPVKINDYVVVQLVPEKAEATPAAYIKQLVRRTGEHLVLQQFNPREEIKIPTRKVLAIHRIMSWTELVGI